jgi:DNA-binding LacI/PurR family transcriptional regulator
MRVTIKDVANRAGVSVTTVSKVLNKKKGPINISPETQQKVYNAMRELNYTPSAAARMLVSGKSQRIGLIAPSFSVVGTFIKSQIFQGLGEVLNQNEYSLEFASVHKDHPSPQTFLKKIINTQSVDGLVLWDCFTDEESLLVLKESSIPCCFLQSHPKSTDFSAVMSDNVLGGYLAARYLLELGHRNIIFVIPPESQEGRERIEGYKKALAEYGVVFNPDLTIFSYFTPHTSINAFHSKRLLELITESTAIFAGSDILAISMIQFLKSEGIRVPDDISVVGFDDIDLASIIHPPLTTIRQYGEDMGRKAATILLNQIKSKEQKPEHHKVTVSLIVRESSKSL